MSASRAKTGGKTGRKRSEQKVTPEPAPAAVLSSTAGVEGSPPAFPIVGIGASAGGLAAFEAFFSGLPADTDPGMAFVLVQHLAPDHKSILSDLIRRYTRMSVFEVEDGMVVMPNCAYIIPPGRDMAFLGGMLQLLDPIAPRGQRLPIDFFFRSLAHDQRERAIGIVLSGTGSDGTHGVRAIKAEGGMVMAQNPASTEFDGMPRSAIGTGLVDYELPPAEMGAQLIAYATHAFGRPPRPGKITAPKVESAIRKIYVLLRAQTGHDFSQYKPSTIHRRIERRMAVHQIEGIDAYVQYLQQTPNEVEALFRDLLIGVTSFFRDPDAFQVLEDQVIPKLFENKSRNAVIRVWTTGCSTGEEAYSIAILLVERMEMLKQSYTVQVFATDIDPQAIATARTGLYPAIIAADLSPERLARFFTAEPGGSTYRIHKGIRDLLVFSEQNVIKDPPFSKLDLISCRNLLIYMGAELQRQLIPLFHYALKPDGFLFLGTSEGVGDFHDLFTAIDRKSKLYYRREDPHGVQRAALGRFLPLMSATAAALPNEVVRTAAAMRKGKSMRETTEQALLSQIIAAGALVNDQGDILYLHGRTGMYLEPAPGETAINNILRMAREGLQRELIATLRKAVGTKDTVVCPGLRVKANGHFTTVNLTIRPVTIGPGATPDAPLYLVILAEALEARVISDQLSVFSGPAAGGDLAPRADGTISPDAEAHIAALKAELRAKDEYLQSTNEELESSTEELKSSNEEMQSVNEELQSTNEELETSKEELQSVNEELATVNSELQAKVTDLSRANNDMNNLLAGTGIGTVFVDHALRILRFTPAVITIINLIPTDVGRPVGHIVSNLVGYSRLVADVQAVLDTLIPKEVEVQTTEGQWYTMRILPYRTLSNTIEGAVITFVGIAEIKKAHVDIAEMKRVEAALRESEEKFSAIADYTVDWETWFGTDGKILWMNPSVERITGYSVAEVLDMPDFISNMIATEDRDLFTATLQGALRGDMGHNVEFRCIHKSGSEVWLEISCQQISNKKGHPLGVRTSARDIAARKQAAEEALCAVNDVLRLAVVVRDAYDAITVQDLAGRIIAWNPGATRMYGWSEAEALAMNVREHMPGAMREDEMAKVGELARSVIKQPYRTQRLTKAGAVVAIWLTATALVNEAGQMYAISTTEQASGPIENRMNARETP